MPKYILVNTNDRPVPVTHRGIAVILKPGVANSLELGEMTPEQILPYRALAQIGVLVRHAQAEQNGHSVKPVVDRVIDMSHQKPAPVSVPAVLPVPAESLTQEPTSADIATAFVQHEQVDAPVELPVTDSGGETHVDETIQPHKNNKSKAKRG